MLIVIAIATMPVVAGVLIVLIPSLIPGCAKTVGPVFTLTALLVAVLQLLPSAVNEIGGIALIFAAACFLVALAFERLFHNGASPIGLGLALGGFLIHQVSDGIQLGISAKLDLGVWGIGPALAAHTLPLTAVIAQAFLTQSGRNTALVIGLIMALTTGLAVPLGGHIAGSYFTETEAWIRALIAGLLLHTIWHKRLRASG